MGITVISVRGLQPGIRDSLGMGFWYVGRTCNGWKGSALGNPHSQGSREQNIALFKKDLWAALQAGLKGQPMTPWQQNAWIEMVHLVQMHTAGVDIKLGCWCDPLACHADVVKAAVVWLAQQDPPTKMKLEAVDY
jgi:hypothetical protein